MELHRCRFVPYNPQAINALEFSHPPSKAGGQGAQTLRLAVGRANGDIEIWNPLRGAWFQETIIRGGKDRTIEGLAWTLDPVEDSPDGSGLKLPGRLRLFSIGYTNTVTEWDLENGKPARHSSGSYGEIWCLTAQPRLTPENNNKQNVADGEYTGQHLAIGCADGSIVILSTADNDLTFVRRLQASTTKNVRVLSITFQNRNTLVAGYADSSIRLFDIRSGRLLRTISLGRGPAGGPKKILVWSIKTLPDGTLVSGDSTGEVRFWDAKNYSLIQRLQGHRADVLDVAVSIDGDSVISGGADRRTVLYKRNAGKKNDKARRWAEVMHRRYHTHDVKTFAVYESKDISIAVSGGPGATLVVLPLREFGKEHHRTLSNLPQISQLASSSSDRFIMSFWEREARIWQIGQRPGTNAENQRNQLVGRVLIPGDDNITSATLSSNGSVLVVATMTTIRLFKLRQENNDANEEGEDDELYIEDLKVPRQLSDNGAKVVSLSPDLRWLCITRPNNDIYLAKLSDSDSPTEKLHIKPTLIHVPRTSRKTTSMRGVNQGTLGKYDRSIRSIAFSSDSKLLATGDLAGNVDCWVLEDTPENHQASAVKKVPNGTDSSDDESSEEEDGNESIIDGQHWKALPTMPSLRAGIAFMSFRPPTSTSESQEPATTEDRLVVVTSTHELVEYEALKGKLSEWSQQNPKSHLPDDFTGIKDRAMGGFCDVFKGSTRLLLYGPTWMWIFDLTRNFPAPKTATIPGTSTDLAKTSPNKRKRVEDETREEQRKYNSGAGDLIPVSQAYVSLGTKIRKIEGKELSNAQLVDTEKHRQQRQDVDEDGNDNSNPFHVSNEPDFAYIRRGITNGEIPSMPSKRLTNGTHKEDEAPLDETDQGNNSDRNNSLQKSSRENQSSSSLFWHSHKFRDILGVVPLGSQGDKKNKNLTTGQKAGIIEIAVVERPMWDIDLGDRYVKEHE
ncbi:putative small nucleolar ribonucleoprotein complex subunit [Talaromyces proteolyticus]|uniref:Small nucleolar ribonucleoprotein complex subunit n=1 Tax=Talaromyces proteolyticus TaxID=1131652 RepID=A0AAD4KKS7_9EURO|nr:putative small nucleolar ribonucleoprotein complex subunit [Talaromyces proteolyticus]KAH8693748.1 putative small nucleolar ribonucleoprotein complex subunit [Talaromyces proteolyticus]